MFTKRSVLILGLVVAMSTLGFAAVTSTNQQVNITATVPESLTVSLSSPTLTFANVVPGNSGNPASSTITVTTKWSLKPSTNALVLYAYFASATAALSDGTFNIPSSAFEISVNGGSNAPVSQSPAGHGVAGATLDLKTVTIDGTNKSGTSVDTLGFNLNLGTITNLQANDYTGTLNIQAQATP